MLGNSLVLDFESIMVDLGIKITKKYGNYYCPFCQHNSLKIYQTGTVEKGKCHTPTCGWNGDVIKLYSDFKQITREEVYKELGIKLKEKKLIMKEQTHQEAYNELLSDLEFLSWVRMYFSFFKSEGRVKQKEYTSKLGISEGTFSKILYGQLGNNMTWRKTLNVLRQEINIKDFKRRLNENKDYFKNQITPEMVKKFQIKKSKSSH